MPKEISKPAHLATDYAARLCRNRMKNEVTQRKQRTAEGTEARSTPHAHTRSTPLFLDRMNRIGKNGRNAKTPAPPHSVHSSPFRPFCLKKQPHPRLKTPNQPDGPPKTLRFSASSAFLPSSLWLRLRRAASSAAQKKTSPRVCVHGVLPASQNSAVLCKSIPRFHAQTRRFPYGTTARLSAQGNPKSQSPNPK